MGATFTQVPQIHLFNTSLTIFIGAGFQRAQLLTWKSNHLFKCSVGDVRLWALQKTWHILFVFV